MIRKGLGAALVVAWGGWLEPAVVQAQAQAPEEEESSCVPACRSGYVCRQGECVSACNPPCDEGERCTASGDCEPTEASPQPTPNPYGPQPEQAPFGSQPRQQQQEQQPRGQVTPAGRKPQPQRHESPSEERSTDGDPGRGFRAAFTLPLLAIGGQTRSPPLEGDTDTDLDPSVGWGALFEANFPNFGLGGGFRNLYWRTQGMGQRFTGIDAYLSPRLRIPFGIGEAFLAAPFGFSMDLPPGGIREDRGLGVNVAVRAGAQFYLGKSGGVFFAVGGLFRMTSFRTGYSPSTGQVLFEVGLAIL
ncbi:MAG: hypothetical protein ACOC9O_02360 [Myxococcota bacterium]